MQNKQSKPDMNYASEYFLITPVFLYESTDVKWWEIIIDTSAERLTAWVMEIKLEGDGTISQFTLIFLHKDTSRCSPYNL